MKIGSLVELVDDNWTRPAWNNEVLPVKDIIYTIRSIEKTNEGAFIRLEEIVNPIYRYLNEVGETQFGIAKFRELQPPIANIEEHINLNSL